MKTRNLQLTHKEIELILHGLKVMSISKGVVKNEFDDLIQEIEKGKKDV